MWAIVRSGPWYSAIGRLFELLVFCFVIALFSRDEAVTKEFVNSLKKVAPSLGMSMGSPKVFMLNDNRPATYIQQLDQVIDMKPAIVMIVIPNNKVTYHRMLEITLNDLLLLRVITTLLSRRSVVWRSPSRASASPVLCSASLRG